MLPEINSIHRRPSIKDGTSSLTTRSSDKRPIITTIGRSFEHLLIKAPPCSVYERSKVSDILSKGQRLLCSRDSIKRRTGWSAEYTFNNPMTFLRYSMRIYISLYFRGTRLCKLFCAYKLVGVSVYMCISRSHYNVTWQS